MNESAEVARGDLGMLRSDLFAANYTTAHLSALWGPTAALALDRGEPGLARYATQGSDDPAAALADLWMLGRAVPRARARAVLRQGWDAALAHRLLRAEGDRVHGQVDLRPHGAGEHAGWVVSDLRAMVTGSPVDPDHVVGVGRASTTLESWVPRPRVERALDLGTGSGVQLLALASHSRHRVGTDISPAAVRRAAVTAALSGVSVDLRQGPWFEPVLGERFGIVVSNPPFVITPRREGARLTYRDGGGVGDEVLRSLIQAVGAHLVPGGIAQFLGNWEVADAARWHERPGAWAHECGLDAWVVQRDLVDVREYAHVWARDAGMSLDEADGTQWYADSVADFERRGVTHIGLGIVTLQRPSEARRPWVHLEEVRNPVQHPMGPHVLAQLRARSWLSMHSDEEVLSVAWTVAPDVTVETLTRPGSPHPLRIQARQASGLGCVRELNALTAGVLGACDGELSARQLVIAVATLLDEDPDQAIADLVVDLRDWVACGLVR